MKDLDEDIRLFLQILQNNIARMNDNSRNCKSWCIAIVAALITVYATMNKVLVLFVSLIFVIVFGFLDYKYLKEERKIRALYNHTISNAFVESELLDVSLKENYENEIKKGWMDNFGSIWYHYCYNCCFNFGLLFE